MAEDFIFKGFIENAKENGTRMLKILTINV